MTDEKVILWKAWKVEKDISKKVLPVIKYYLLALLAIVVLINVGLWAYWQYNSYLHIDDLTVEGKMLPIKTKVAGQFLQYTVADGHAVASGEVIAKIKPQAQDLSKLTTALQKAEADYQTMLSEQNMAVTSVATAPASQSNKEALRFAYQTALAKKNKMEMLYKEGAISANMYKAAASALEVAEQNLRTATTVTNFAPSHKQTPLSQADLKAAQLRVQQARLALENAQKQSKETVIVAPAPGVIHYGKELSAKQNIKAGETICQLANASDMWLAGSLSQGQAEKVKPGMYVSCSIGGKDIAGVVANLLPDKKKQKVTVYISLPVTALDKLEIGMSGTAKIALQ